MLTSFSFRSRPYVLAFVLLVAVASSSTAQQLFTPLDLGTLGGSSSLAFGVNEAGDVVGEALLPSGIGHGFVWRRGVMTDVGTFPGDDRSIVFDINNAGVAVGYSFAAGVGRTHPFAWNGGVLTHLPLLDGHTSGAAYAINNSGHIVGTSQDVAVEWVNGVVHRLEMDGGVRSTAEDINDAGQIVGSILWPSLGIHERAAIWNGGVPQPLADAVFGTCVADCVLSSTAFGISDDGRIVGDASDLDEHLHVIRWNPDGTVAVLAALPGTQFSQTHSATINNRGEIAGSSLLGSGQVPTFWASSGVPQVLLRPSGASELGSALGINNAGQVVGGINAHATLWTPVPARVRITVPNAATRWGIGTTQRIAWSYDGSAPQFHIEISRNGGGLWDSLATVANLNGTSQNFSWLVTGPATPNARFRVTPIGDEAASDVNDGNVAIAPAAIDIIYPSRTTVLPVGSVVSIFWRHNLGARKPVIIEVSDNGGATWHTVISRRDTKGETTSSFRWLVSLPPTSSARLRIRALDGTGAIGLSEVFTVTGASARVR